jgi:hypothetical protein
LKRSWVKVKLVLRKKKGLKLSELDSKFYHVTNIYSEVPKIFYFPLWLCTQILLIPKGLVDNWQSTYLTKLHK